MNNIREKIRDNINSELWLNHTFYITRKVSERMRKTTSYIFDGWQEVEYDMRIRNRAINIENTIEKLFYKNAYPDVAQIF